MRKRLIIAIVTISLLALNVCAYASGGAEAAGGEAFCLGENDGLCEYAMGCPSAEAYTDTTALAADRGVLGGCTEANLADKAYREVVVNIAYDVATACCINGLEFKEGADGAEPTNLTLRTLTAVVSNYWTIKSLCIITRGLSGFGRPAGFFRAPEAAGIKKLTFVKVVRLLLTIT